MPKGRIPAFSVTLSRLGGNKITDKVEKYVEKSGEWKELNYSRAEEIFGKRVE